MVPGNPLQRVVDRLPRWDLPSEVFNLYTRMALDYGGRARMAEMSLTAFGFPDRYEIHERLENHE